MRTNITITMFALLLLFVSSSSFAATYSKNLGFRYAVVAGSIVSVDQTKRVFAIKDHDDGRVYRLSAGSSDITSLVQGENARVTLSLPGNAVSKIGR